MGPGKKAFRVLGGTPLATDAPTSPSFVNAELVEETYEEPQGYFARLRSHRLARSAIPAMLTTPAATSAETMLYEQRCNYPIVCRDIPDTGIQAPPILSLDRVSSPLDMPPPFQHSPTMGARSATLYGSLPRSSTMPLGRRELRRALIVVDEGCQWTSGGVTPFRQICNL